MKNITILGSTGSIGIQTLDVMSQHPDMFRVAGLSAGENINILREQILKFRPEAVSVRDRSLADTLRSELCDYRVEILHGPEGASEIASLDSSDLVVSAIVGASGLIPTLSAIKAGKDVALANKESLVVAGEILTDESEKMGNSIIPVDSEHSAIFQALESCGKKFVKRLIITASGGPFLNTPLEDMKDVTVEVALKHPTWRMGDKITIDSATLMNKGFEVIEAKWLFGFGPEQIDVWIHPQSIVHSMVEYIDGSLISQMSMPDMKIPIAYALSYPERISMNGYMVVPESFRELTFREVDHEKFPSISLAFGAIREGGTMPAVMNGANEVAVRAFLNGETGFTDIVRIVEKVMSLHKTQSASSLEAVLDSDAWARKSALRLIRNQEN
ncbi:MAG: 1-deoxy-D-xylulose-5-phosphate reductoisomerase [Thermodesulfobacteriota bacterium]